MASEFKITEKQFNGTDYDTLYPKTISQQNIISNSNTLTALGLSSGATVDDGLVALAGSIANLTNGKCQVEIGNYNGNNTSTKTLTFQHIPRLLWVWDSSVNMFDLFDVGSPSTVNGIILNKQFIVFNLSNSTSHFTVPVRVASTSGQAEKFYVTWNKDDNTKKIGWTFSDTACGCNATGSTYYYFAITSDTI